MTSNVFTIDGSIGVGKSSVLAYLNENYGIRASQINAEPINVWQPYLKDLYSAGAGAGAAAAFNFQVRVWMDRCWLDPTHPLSHKMVIMERSPLFNEKVFVAINKDCGRISDSQFGLLTDLYARTNKMWSPAGYIYLRSQPQQCLEHIAERARNSEETIQLDYLEQVHVLHEKTFNDAIANGVNITCIEVDGKTIAKVAEEVWHAMIFLRLSSIPAKPIKHYLGFPVVLRIVLAWLTCIFVFAASMYSRLPKK